MINVRRSHLDPLFKLTNKKFLIYDLLFIYNYQK